MKHHLKIDLLKLYTESSCKEWNAWLNKCESTNDLNELSKRLKGIQIGMDDITKQKLNGEKICVWFLRLQKSIEKTMKNILKKKYPSPLDNPKYKGTHEERLKFICLKRKRDSEFEKYFKKVSW